MKVAAEFGDPQALTKLRCDALRAAASRPFLTNLTIGTVLPPASPQGDLLIVRSGIWTEYNAPITAVNIVRIVAWSLDEDTAWDIASWFHAMLLAAPGDATVHSYRTDDPPRKGTDPDYDTPIAAFTIAARMRPQIL